VEAVAPLVEVGRDRPVTVKVSASDEEVPDARSLEHRSSEDSGMLSC
jgi:hypothetical protein